jgi:DNA polymerase-3 subunit epsilon
MGLLERIFGGTRDHALPPAVERHMGLKKRMDMSIPVLEAEYVVFDTELTGLDFKKDSIVSIGAVKMKGAGIYPSKAFHSLVKPECELKSESVLVHEITHQDLEGACGLGEVVGEFLEFIGDAVLVGHFVFIDVNFVGKAMKALYGVGLESTVVDTHSMHDWLYKNDAEFTRHYRGMTTKSDLFSMAKHSCSRDFFIFSLHAA